MKNWDKIEKLIAWFLICAISGIVAIALFNVIFP
jgi:hypothetical protein